MSADPWTHEYLKAKARTYEAKVGQEVTVIRYGRRPVEGLLMRVAPTGLVIAGHGVISHYEVESVR